MTVTILDEEGKVVSREGSMAFPRASSWTWTAKTSMVSRLERGTTPSRSPPMIKTETRWRSAIPQGNRQRDVVRQRSARPYVDGIEITIGSTQGETNGARDADGARHEHHPIGAGDFRPNLSGTGNARGEIDGRLRDRWPARQA